MNFKKTCTNFLKTTIEGTQKTLDLINVNKIAENLETVKKKASDGLENLRTKLDEGLKDEDFKTTNPVEDVIITEPLIDELNLSENTIKILKENNIETVNELRNMRDEDLLDIKGIGQKTLEEIKESLK